jgi:hypothetical protein
MAEISAYEVGMSVDYDDRTVDGLIRELLDRVKKLEEKVTELEERAQSEAYAEAMKGYPG